jgi:hypothetical protein
MLFTGWFQKLFLTGTVGSNSSLFNEFVCKLGSLWQEWASLKRE